jgi:hypothetical protein
MQFGFAIAGGEDLDGDGVPDLLVGAPGAWGYVAAHSGRDGRELGTIRSRFPDEEFGASVAFLDDIDGDGTSDFAFSNLWLGLDMHWGEVVVCTDRTCNPIYRVHSPNLRK